MIGRRDLVPVVSLLVLLAAFAFFAALTRAPQAPIFERAERWPVIGRAIVELRRIYLPSGPATEPAGGGGEGAAAPPAVRLRPQSDVRGETERFLRAGLGEFVLLVPGATLHIEPAQEGELVERVESLRRAQVLEHRGDWVRVARREGSGWAWTNPNRPGMPPPLGVDPIPPRPLPGHPPPAERLAEARRLLGARERRLEVGPYALYTDYEDRELEALLADLAARAEAAYRHRYGRRPRGEAAEALVLFSRREAYERFQDGLERLAGMRSGGHVSLGLAALYVEGRSRHEVGRSLLHELGHLLNRRALGPALPPWLDEGLAEDFSHWALLSGAGASWAYYREEQGDRVWLRAGLASLQRAVAELQTGTLMPLRELLGLEWEAFVAAPRGPRHYGQAALLVLFLQEGEERWHRGGWHGYLDAVAAGESVAAESLLEHLGLEWSVLERGFRAWLHEEAGLAGI